MSGDAALEAGLHKFIREARQAWRAKPALRAVYNDYYRLLLDAAGHGGKILEIGAGSGHSRDAFGGEDVTRLDILAAPWIDVVADAHDIPLPSGAFDAIVMIDVLHHLADPPKFFAEAARLLKPGGRLAMIEPAITPVAEIFFRLFHEEPVDMSADPLADQDYGADKDPFDSNQAIPTLLFKDGKARAAFEARIPGLRVRGVRWLSLAAYPMCGGFKSWSLVSEGGARALLKLEGAIAPALGRLAGFRLFVVLEKTPAR